LNEFEWNKEKARANLFKHNLSFEEAITVFDDPFAVYFEDDFHSIQEERYIVRGYSNTNNLLIVNFTLREKITRIISARFATKKERKQHEK
jgi:uncharacterized protein